MATVARDFVRQFGIRRRADWFKVERQLGSRADEQVDSHGAGPLAVGWARDALPLTPARAYPRVENSSRAASSNRSRRSARCLLRREAGGCESRASRFGAAGGLITRSSVPAHLSTVDYDYLVNFDN